MRGKIIALVVLSLAILSGCSNSVSEIGANLFNSALFNINYVDSATVKISTVKTDSLITSNTGRLLVGYHEDPKLGKVSVKSAFQIGVTTPTVLDRFNTDYVGLTLYLKRDGYSYYDTTQSQTISVYQLTDQLHPINGALFNGSKFQYDKSAPPLGSLTFLPRPHKTDSVEVHLSDVLGQELIEKQKDNDLEVRTTQDFIRYFKGLVMVADSSASRNMIGFSSKAEVRLYYNDRTVSPAKLKWLSYSIGSNYSFNYFYADRSATQLNQIVKFNDAVSSQATNHEGYIQSGLGLGVRLEMPYLRNFLFSDRNFRISRAILEVRPVLEYPRPAPLPTVLYLYRVDDINRLQSNIPLSGGLFTDVESGQDTHYEADVTAFVNFQIQNDVINNNGLLLLLDDKQNRSSISRLFIGDTRSQYIMRLKLYYITLSNQ